MIKNSFFFCVAGDRGGLLVLFCCCVSPVGKYCITFKDLIEISKMILSQVERSVTQQVIKCSQPIRNNKTAICGVMGLGMKYGQQEVSVTKLITRQAC